MEKMPFRDAQDGDGPARGHGSRPATMTTTSDWKQALPVLTGSMVTLRELRLSDATSLLAMLSTEEVARFISPPPTTVEGFERFIAWTHRERAAGNYVCFAVVPHGMDTAIGIFQVRQLEPGFGTAEWGFAIGSAFWGTGDVHGRRRAGHRLCVRRHRHAPARSPRGDPRTVAATARCGRLARCRKASCASRSSATASISTRRCGPSSTRTGAAAGRSGGRRSTNHWGAVRNGIGGAHGYAVFAAVFRFLAASVHKRLTLPGFDR